MLRAVEDGAAAAELRNIPTDRTFIDLQLAVFLLVLRHVSVWMTG